MAEGTYEYECERAELLGVSPPDRETWEQNQKARLEQEQEELEIAQDAEIGHQGEQLQGTSGKLDELNSILANTQKKLNTKFKVVCGGLTSLMKFRPGGSTSNVNEDHQQSNDESGSTTAETAQNENNALLSDEATTNDGPQASNVTPKRSVRDIGHKVGKQIDVLDSLISKSERAELSMHQQNKEMKRHLK
uniref:CSON013204 protein n=1 Tax=Culicoides sonorensis TaxID=179676 RepID=A0A336M7D0_CULSO